MSSTWVRECCGGAVRISVGTTPWIVNEFGQIFRRLNNRLDQGSWVKIPGFAREITALKGRQWDYAWHIGHDGTIYGWNEQREWVTDSGNTSPARSGWVNWGVGGYALAVDGRGNVWRAYNERDSDWIARPTH